MAGGTALRGGSQRRRQPAAGPPRQIGRSPPLRRHSQLMHKEGRGERRNERGLMGLLEVGKVGAGAGYN
eukprot:165566-Chlamydomonas_euryale.AAC.5